MKFLQSFIKKLPGIGGSLVSREPPEAKASPSNIMIRAATEQDIEEISALVLAESQHGHFNQIMTDEQIREDLTNQFKRQLQSIIKSGYFMRFAEEQIQNKKQFLKKLKKQVRKKQALTLPHVVSPGVLAVITVDGCFAGFHLVYGYEPPDRSNQSHLEYYMLAIKPAYRKRGLATMLIDFALEYLPHEATITVRVYPASEIMYQCLLKKGFLLKEITPHGTRKLVLPPQA